MKKPICPICNKVVPKDDAKVLLDGETPAHEECVGRMVEEKEWATGKYNIKTGEPFKKSKKYWK